MKTTITTATTTEVKVNIDPEETHALDSKVTPKGMGKLDMVIAFDTTGSMAFEESARRSDDGSVRSYCMSRSIGLRGKLFDLFKDCNDDELNNIKESYSREVNDRDE